MKKHDERSLELSQLLDMVDYGLLEEAYSVDSAEKLERLVASQSTKQKNAKKHMFSRRALRRIVTVAACLTLVVAILLSFPVWRSIFAPSDGSQGSGDTPGGDIPSFSRYIEINSMDKLNYYAAIKIVGVKESGASQKLSALAAPLSADHAVATLSEPASTEYDKNGVYYYEVDKDRKFTVSKVTLFKIEITSDNRFLASKIGTGTVDVAVTENSLEPMITFKNGDRFYSCMWSNGESGVVSFSTQKYTDGFFIVKDAKQQSYAFELVFNGDAVAAMNCLEISESSQINVTDSITIIPDTCKTSSASESFTAAELEQFFNNNKEISGGENNAEDTVPSSEELKYTSYSDGTCSVSGIGGFTGSNLIIPTTSPAGDRVVAIGNNAFYACNQLASVVIPSSVTTIEAFAFESCVNLKKVTMADSVTKIQMGAFSRCTALESVYLSRSLTSWDAIAFYNCKSLTSIDIPDGITKIPSSTFMLCESLESVKLPASLAVLDSDAFTNCYSLTNISISATNRYFHVKNNCLIKTASKVLVLGGNNGVIPDDGSITSIEARAFAGRSRLSVVTVPEGVVSIGSDAFSTCRALTQVILPSTLERIGSYVFANCSALKDVSIPENVTSIERGAFAFCGSLVDISIPDGIREISPSLFIGCRALTHVTLPSALSSIEESAFACNSSTLVLTFGGTRAEWDKVIKATGWYNAVCGIICSDDVKGSAGFEFGWSNSGMVHINSMGVCTDKHIIIPAISPNGETVIGINRYAFKDCHGIESVTIDVDLQAICSGAFTSCDSLVEVNISGNIELFAINAFYNCKSLEYVSISGDVAELPSYAFNQCSSLKVVDLSKDVKSIGYRAFDCSSEHLTINYDGTMQEWEAVTKHQGWNSAAEYTVNCIDGQIISTNN